MCGSRGSLGSWPWARTWSRGRFRRGAPSACATPAELVEDVVVDPQGKTVQVRLAQKQLRPFSVTLIGFYPRPAGPAVKPGLEEATLDLPRPAAWGLDRGGEGERRAPAAGG